MAALSLAIARNMTASPKGGRTVPLFSPRHWRWQTDRPWTVAGLSIACAALPAAFSRAATRPPPRLCRSGVVDGTDNLAGNLSPPHPPHLRPHPAWRQPRCCWHQRHPHLQRLTAVCWRWAVDYHGHHLVGATIAGGNFHLLALPGNPTPCQHTARHLHRHTFTTTPALTVAAGDVRQERDVGGRASGAKPYEHGMPERYLARRLKHQNNQRRKASCAGDGHRTRGDSTSAK